MLNGTIQSLIKQFIFIFFFILLCSFSYTHKIILNNGKVVNGDILLSNIEVKKLSGEIVNINLKDIYSITTPKQNKFISISNNYSMIIPDNWKIISKSSDEKILTIASKDGGKITVLIQNFEKNRTFFDYVNSSLDDIKKNGFELIEKKSKEHPSFDESLYFKMKITSDKKIFIVEQMSLYKSDSKTNYLITFVYLKSLENKFKGVFAKFIETFKFII